MTQCYHEAIEAVQQETYTKEKVDAWTQRLRSVYNRDFWDGYYLGRKMGEWSERYGSQATRVKQHVGKVTNFFSNISVAEISIEEDALSVGDEMLIIGPTTGVYEDTVPEIRVDLKPVGSAPQGELCSVPVKQLVRRGDQVYKWVTVTDEF